MMMDSINETYLEGVMSFFSWLFGKNKPQETRVNSPKQDNLKPTPVAPVAHTKPPSLTVEIVAESRSEPTGFVTPSHVVRKAFDSIMADMHAPGISMEALYQDYLYAVQHGDYTAPTKVLKEYLLGTEWRWPWYEEWMERFRSQGRLPTRYEASVVLGRVEPAEPKSFEDAETIFSITEIRAWIKEQGLPVKARSKSELFARLAEHVGWEQFESAAQAQYAKYLPEFQKKRDEALCDELASSLSGKIYAYQRLQQLLELSDNSSFARWRVPYIEANDDDSPIAREKIRQFNSGDYSEVPPFFPGDFNRVSIYHPPDVTLDLAPLDITEIPDGIGDWLNLARQALEHEDYDQARQAYQKAAYGYAQLNSEQNEQLKHEIARFARRDPRYRKAIEIIQAKVFENPSITQAEIGKQTGDNREWFNYVVYYADVLNHLVRVKSGRTYKLYLPGLHDALIEEAMSS